MPALIEGEESRGEDPRPKMEEEEEERFYLPSKVSCTLDPMTTTLASAVYYIRSDADRIVMSFQLNARTYQ